MKYAGENTINRIFELAKGNSTTIKNNIVDKKAELQQIVGTKLLGNGTDSVLPTTIWCQGYLNVIKTGWEQASTDKWSGMYLGRCYAEESIEPLYCYYQSDLVGKPLQTEICNGAINILDNIQVNFTSTADIDYEYNIPIGVQEITIYDSTIQCSVKIVYEHVRFELGVWQFTLDYVWHPGIIVV